MNPMFTRYKFFGLMLLLAVLSFGWTQVRAADEHSHDASHGTLMLNDGQKWATDAPLRRAMTRIGDAIGARLPEIHEDKLGSADYTTLGKAIDGDVAYMVENCKLPSDADAMLHLVLAEIIEGSKAMQGKADGTGKRSGAIKVVKALYSYGKYFDHPGWQPPAH